jgi:hypothetical protein
VCIGGSTTNRDVCRNALEANGLGILLSECPADQSASTWTVLKALGEIFLGVASVPDFGVGDVIEGAYCPLFDVGNSAPEAVGGASSRFVQGELYETTVSTSAGDVAVAAEVDVSGSELTLSGISVFNADGGPLVNQIGASQFLALRNEIATDAASEGFETLRLQGVRVPGSSSSAPGKAIDIIINLSKFR